MPRDERVPVELLGEVLEVSRVGYYAWKNPGQDGGQRSLLTGAGPFGLSGDHRQEPPQRARVDGLHAAVVMLGELRKVAPVTAQGVR